MSEFYLSQDEIAVIAAMMKADVIYGVQSELYTHFQSFHSQKIGEIMEQLMERQLFHIGFDQYVHMNKDLYDAFDTIINAQKLLIIDQTYYYNKDGLVYQLKPKSHLYHIKKALNSFDFNKHSLKINERLNNQDLLYIEEALDSFDEDEAYDYLKKKCNNASLMMDIINEQYQKMNVEYYKWENQKLIEKHKLIVGIYNDQYFEIDQNDDGYHYVGGTSHTAFYIDQMFRR